MPVRNEWIRSRHTVNPNLLTVQVIKYTAQPQVLNTQTNTSEFLSNVSMACQLLQFQLIIFLKAGGVTLLVIPKFKMIPITIGTLNTLNNPGSRSAVIFTIKFYCMNFNYKISDVRSHYYCIIPPEQWDALGTPSVNCVHTFFATCGFERYGIAFANLINESSDMNENCLIGGGVYNKSKTFGFIEEFDCSFVLKIYILD